jgi:hypothetical protein
VRLATDSRNEQKRAEKPTPYGPTPAPLLARHTVKKCTESPGPLYSSVFVGALLIAGHATLALYGHPYDTEFAAYALLLGVQWANGIGRPAIRNAVVGWDEPRIQALGVLRRPRDCVA